MITVEYIQMKFRKLGCFNQIQGMGGGRKIIIAHKCMKKNCQEKKTSRIGSTTMYMSLQYKEKSDQILHSLHNLVTNQVKYIPSVDKVMNYVYPTMKKRRFSDVIIPRVRDKILKLIDELRNRHYYMTSPQTRTPEQHVPNQLYNSLRDIEKMNVDLDDSRSVISVSSSIKSTDTLKRAGHKRNHQNNDDLFHDVRHKKSVISIKPEITNQNKMSCESVDIVYSKYSTFKTSQKELPPLQFPPDMTPKITIGLNDETASACSSIVEAAESAGSKSCLVTLHNPEASNLPKSHVHISMGNNTCELGFLQVEYLQKVILELFIKDEHIHKILDITETYKSQLIITLPQRCIHILKDLLPNLHLTEIPRPFLHLPSSYVTT
jgi:hypothetical protein